MIICGILKASLKRISSYFLALFLKRHKNLLIIIYLFL